MSDILAGQTEHSSYAPLTQAQTIAICQHLQQEIRNVEATVAEIQRDVGHTKDSVQNLKERNADSHDEIHGLQVSLANTNASLEKLSSEHARTCSGIAELQSNDQSMKNKVCLLDEANKIADTARDMMQREFNKEKDSLRSLSEVLDKLTCEDFKKMQKDFASTKLYLEQVAEEQGQVAELGQKNREAVREAKLEIENTVNEMKKSNTVTSILESRLSTTTQGLQQSNGQFAAVHAQLLKLTECYEQTKARVGETEIKIKEVNDANKSTQHELDDRTREIEALTDKVAASLRGLERESGSSDELRHQINAVRGSIDQLMRKVTSMQNELKDCVDATYQVRSGLKEQSAMLLPNIHMDSPGGAGGLGDFGSPASARVGTANSTKRPSGSGASPNKSMAW